MTKKIILSILTISMILFCSSEDKRVGETTITKWQNNKKAAVSVTFDDSTINHFRIALPLLEERGFPGTFYIMTGAVPGSQYEGKFLGRSVEEIIAETAEIPTNEYNFFERASAIRYLGYEDLYQYFLRAARHFEGDRIAEAYTVIDEGYENVRNGVYASADDLSPYLNEVMVIDPEVELITWDELRTFDATFHEFGSHSITHPYLSVLNEENLLYELKKSKQDILNHLGEEHTFTVEAPFGIEDERVMEYLYEIYFATRNRMPEPWLEELNRSSRMNPSESDMEYVQWQRGPLKETSMNLMKSWVDTIVEQDNIWLVLVFHGVEGIGWEPKSEAELTAYFDYLKNHEEYLWVDTFVNVTKYLRQRMNAQLTVKTNSDMITVRLTHELGELYDLPLTLKTRVPSDWQTVVIRQGNQSIKVSPINDEKGAYILYQAHPNISALEISE